MPVQPDVYDAVRRASLVVAIIDGEFVVLKSRDGSTDNRREALITLVRTALGPEPSVPGAIAARRLPAAGDRMKFTGEGGYPDERAAARRTLIVGAIYEVTRADIGSFHTELTLRHVDGTWNSAMFEYADEPCGKATPPTQVHVTQFRTTKVFRDNGQWDVIEFEALRKGDRFRLYEGADCTLVGNCTLVALGDPYPIGTEGNWGIDTERYADAGVADGN